MTRIFIISSYPMFGRGLESLLRQDASLDIMGRETDVDRALDRIRVLQPDFVIVDSSSPTNASMLAVMRILQENSGVKVVGLSLQDNLLYLYQATQSVIKDVDDLIEVIGQDGAASQIASQPLANSSPVR